MRRIIYPFLTASVFLLPALASAQSVADILVLASTVLNALIGLLITAAIVTLGWGVVKYIFKDAGDEKKEGMKIILKSVLAIFIMVSIWGIIRLLQNTFKVTSTNAIVPSGVQINSITY